MPGESFASWTLTPITTPAEVRKLTGYTATADADDPAVVAIIARAQTFVVHELSERMAEVALWGSIDGTNTRFELPPRMHGRVLLNASNSGNEKDDCRVFLRQRVTTGSSPPAYTAATIASADALHGQVVLSPAPDPALYDRVLFSGFLVLAAVTKDRFQACVELYAAAWLDTRVREPGKKNLTNPAANKEKPDLEGSRFWPIYQREVRRIKRPGSHAASVKTRLPFNRDWTPTAP